MEELNEYIKTEWIEQGYQENDFHANGSKILVILDNASFHKKKGIWQRIEQTLPNVQLYFLPAYSPNYNLIELVWHSAKEYIAHLFKSASELKPLLDC